MATNAGVWIDHKQAVVVLMTDAGQEIKKIKSDLEQTRRPAGTRTKSTSYTPNDFTSEDKRQRRIEGEQSKFYDEIIACLREVKAVLILGPGEAKGEFSKHMKAKKVRNIVVEMETADKMTDHQVAAKVKQHFAESPAKKSVAPKRMVKKASKATAAGPPKRSDKKTKVARRRPL